MSDQKTQIEEAKQIVIAKGDYGKRKNILFPKGTEHLILAFIDQLWIQAAKQTIKLRN